MQADYDAIISYLRERGLEEAADAIETLLGQLYEAEEELRQLEHVRAERQLERETEHDAEPVTL